MKEREYEAWCGSCKNHWYLRLRGITDPAPLVTCPRCGKDGIANLIDWPDGRDKDMTEG